MVLNDRCITYIELTDILKIFIQRLYQVVNELQDRQLIFIMIHTDNEKQRGVASVDTLVVTIFQE